MNKKLRTFVSLLFVGFALLLVACTGDTTDTSQVATATDGTALVDSGTLYLKVNPEIAINYDDNGKVTSIVGENDDGQEIIDLYPDYIGKDSGLVVKDLIALIGDAGYFIEEIEGEAKKIVIELESGSALPDDRFLEVMAASAQAAVQEYKLNSNVVVDGETYITLEDAKKIAFEHAGVDGTKAKFDDQEFDLDDGVPSYELEFDVDNVEYEYDIHAISGEIIKFEQDRDDKNVAKPANTSNNSGYDNSAYGETAKPAAKPASKPIAKPAAKPASKPIAKPAAKPAPKPAKRNDTDYSDYSDYSDYDDTDYSDYDDSDYSDYSDYDDSDYD